MILPNGILKRNPEQLLEGDLNILINSIEITDPETQKKRKLNQEERQALRNEILQRIRDLNLKYFEEQEMINLIKEAVDSLNLPNPNEISDQIIESRGTEEYLNSTWKNILENYFRNSPEKEGINFRDKIEDSEELKAWLYLTIKDENLRNNFASDFQRALTQKEKFYFRIWPPYVGIKLKKLMPPVPTIEPRFDVGEFLKEVRSYTEDLQKGKSKITFYFEEDLLPDQFKDQSGNLDQQKLQRAGINKVGNVYEISLTRDDVQNLIINVVNTHPEIISKDAEINILLKELKDLYREVYKKAPKELKNSLLYYVSLIGGIETYYRKQLERGISKEELDNFKKMLIEIKNHLNSVKQLIEIGETKKPETLKNVKKKIFEFMNESGAIILSTIGLWGLALGWFLPLWIIVKLQKEVDKAVNVGH